MTVGYQCTKWERSLQLRTTTGGENDPFKVVFDSNAPEFGGDAAAAAAAAALSWSPWSPELEP